MFGQAWGAWRRVEGYPRRERARPPRATVVETVEAVRPAATPGGSAARGRAPLDELYDAVIIGGGMGGLATATQMAAKGARVVVLEK